MEIAANAILMSQEMRPPENGQEIKLENKDKQLKLTKETDYGP